LSQPRQPPLVRGVVLCISKAFDGSPFSTTSWAPPFLTFVYAFFTPNRLI
jgi:hypothetical protein